MHESDGSAQQIGKTEELDELKQVEGYLEEEQQRALAVTKRARTQYEHHINGHMAGPKSGQTKDSPIEDGSTKQSLSNKHEIIGGAATGDEGSGSYGNGTSVQVK